MPLLLPARYNPSGTLEHKAAIKLKRLCADEVRNADELGIPLTASQRQKMAKRKHRDARSAEKHRDRKSDSSKRIRDRSGGANSSSGGGAASGGLTSKKITKVDLYQGLIKSIKDAEDEGGTRKLAKHFLSLPNKDDFPEYYEIIKRPVRPHTHTHTHTHTLSLSLKAPCRVSQPIRATCLITSAPCSHPLMASQTQPPPPPTATHTHTHTHIHTHTHSNTNTRSRFARGSA
jgi:hypothetical protein